MWMSQPTPVTTSIITTVSRSACKSKPARKLPEAIQVKNSLRESACTDSKNSRTASSAQRNERPAERMAESHKSKVHRVEHQLDGHENGDDIALENEGEHSEPKQNRAQDYVVVCWDHLSFSPAAPEPSRPESPPESGTMSVQTDKRNP